MAALQGFQEFIQGVREEWSRVTWPDRSQLVSVTQGILVFVIILAVIIWIMDTTFSTLVRGIVGVFSG
jgi:preprotein translocase subunit SecE